MVNSILLTTQIFVFSIIVLSFFNGEKKIFGRPIWYVPKKILTLNSNSKDTNHQIFDIYSVSHFNTGVIIYFFDLFLISKYGNFLKKKTKLNIITISLTLFEITENTPRGIESFTGIKDYSYYSGDSIVNIIGDIYIAIMGYFISVVIQKYMIIYFILSEIIVFKKKAGTISMFLSWFKRNIIRRYIK